MQFCGIFSCKPSYQLFIHASYDVELSFKPLLEPKDWKLLSWKTWTLVIQTDDKSKSYKHIACFNFYICSWIRATIGMYKTISTDAKNSPTWNTAISISIVDTKIPCIHVTTQNMVFVIWHKKYIWNKSNWVELC